MVSANQFDCHSPAPVQKPVQVQGSTSKEYGEDVGGAVSRNWESGLQEKWREQATCSHARHCWDHSCELASSPAWKSVRQLAAENEVSPSTAWHIFRTDLCKHPYNSHVFQSLTTVCWEKRTRFAQEFGDRLQQNPHTLEHIWFSDEAYFNLTGDINRQNAHFWGTQHPHKIHKSTLHALKVLVWCAVSAQGLIGPFMFEDYVTGENYAMMLDSFLLSQQRQHSLHAQWFQQDGARPHTTP
jgi:hypothetical protein